MKNKFELDDLFDGDFAQTALGKKRREITIDMLKLAIELKK